MPMGEPRQHTPLVFVADGAILLLCVVGWYFVAQKAGVGFRAHHSDSRVYCIEVPDAAYERCINVGEITRSVGGVPIGKAEGLEFLLDARRPGKRVEFVIEGPRGVRGTYIRWKDV